jgi:hypothetical protein
MSHSTWIPLLFLLWTGGQTEDPPAYVREGDRIEQEFRAYRERLNRFFDELRGVIQQQTPAVRVQLPPLQDAPPRPVVYGYGVLPRIVDPPAGGLEPVTVFSYSWPITEGYISGETIKLERAEAELREVPSEAAADDRTQAIAKLVREYRTLVGNQTTIDQYIQYNRFWQSSIANDRPHFEQLTKLYDLMKSGEPDVTAVVRQVLGKPDVPSYIQFNQPEPDRVVLTVPVYTDIADQEFLTKVKTTVEEMWQTRDADLAYAVQVEFRPVTGSDLYPDSGPPENGARFEMRSHAARFPADGAVLTTGGQSTHSLVGRYIALASGNLSTQTLAHEFGHVLGFRDGYIRGYRDLAERGFEILELTSVFDDIMSAPRQGHVQPAHFKLIIEALTASKAK